MFHGRLLISGSSILCALIVSSCSTAPGGRYKFIVHPGANTPETYVVQRAAKPVDISSGWGSPQWRNIKPVSLQTVLFRPGSSTDHNPETQVKLQYDDKFLYGLFRVKDRYVKAVARHDQEQVCRDSAVEFFVKPPKSRRYFNFEFNCGGTLLLYDILNLKAKKYEEVSREELDSIGRFHSLPKRVPVEIVGPVTWELGFRIPLDFFVRRAGVRLPLSGQTWTGNFTKCADKTSHPHWLSWAAVRTFHFPKDFNRLTFE